jgi:hypothetical protein
MTPLTQSRAFVALEMDREPDERRAMIRVARLAAAPESPPHPKATRRPTSAWEQSMQAATGWMYLAPLLCVSPFLWNTPLWIAALSQLPERR